MSDIKAAARKTAAQCFQQDDVLLADSVAAAILEAKAEALHETLDHRIEYRVMREQEYLTAAAEVRSGE